jgi:hypothetical protein
MVGTSTAHPLALGQYITLSLASTQSLSERSKSLLDHSKITVYLNRALLKHEAKEVYNIKKCYRWKESKQ